LRSRLRMIESPEGGRLSVKQQRCVKGGPADEINERTGCPRK
jgi:hypothetical protein